MQYDLCLVMRVIWVVRNYRQRAIVDSDGILVAMLCQVAQRQLLEDKAVVRVQLKGALQVARASRPNVLLDDRLNRYKGISRHR